jgi:magnesium-transporting ATPase (P-type)
MTKNLLLESMASCTAITYVNGALIGDPLDVKMF